MYKRKIMAFICAVLIFIIGCASSKQMTWQELKYDEVVSMIDGNKTFYAFFLKEMIVLIARLLKRIFERLLNART